MAGLILKCRYLKQGSKKHSENLIRYIAKREGVEMSDDSWKCLPATEAQEKFIEEILSDYPDMKNESEYEEYIRFPTKGSASEFIDHAIDDNADLIGKRENYVGYIAKRPRVEKEGSHGLFTDSNIPIKLSHVAKEVALHEGNVWTDIISLKREDAERLGYDNAAAWKNLLRGHTDAIARSMKIPLEDLRWYAAFHNEGYHPHVHMVAYSVGKEPYMTERGILKLKSELANEIFKQDLLQIYSKQTENRNALKGVSKEIFTDIIGQIHSNTNGNETIELLLQRLSEQLKDYTGKKVYGYLPKTAKNIVNGIVDELEKDERIAKLYDMWYMQREAVIHTYSDNVPKRVSLSANKEFKSIKNMIISETENLLNNKVTFEDDDINTEVFDTDGSNNGSSLNRWNNPSSMYYQYRKAKEYLDKESEEYNPEEAVRWLKMSAEQGYEYAQYRLGKMLVNGDETEQDIGQGLEWLRKAEEQNNEYAQYFLGKLYLKGEKVESDTALSEILFEKASEQGNAYAKYSLAKMNIEGTAQNSSIRKAVRLLEESADKRFEWAEYQLGKMYLYGQGVEINYGKGTDLLQNAAEKGNIYAKLILENYRKGNSLSLLSFKLIAGASRILANNVQKDLENDHFIDKKLLKKIAEKKQSLGIRME